MRGREAVRSAQRREGDAKARADELDQKLKDERAAFKAERLNLEEEIRRLRADHLAEAAKLAQAEIKRLEDAREQERQSKGLSDDAAVALLWQKDRFIMNACRYVSMTTGKPPGVAISLVMTWVTDHDFFGFSGYGKDDFIRYIGVPPNGWVATAIAERRDHLDAKLARRDRRRGEASAISLDKAEQTGHPDIHPDYKPQWYATADIYEAEWKERDQE